MTSSWTAVLCCVTEKRVTREAKQGKKDPELTWGKNMAHAPLDAQGQGTTSSWTMRQQALGCTSLCSLLKMV